MIINVSRAKGFMSCRQREYNWSELKLTSPRTAEPLMQGAGTHTGFAHVLATGKVEEAVALGEEEIRAEIKKGFYLSEELAELEKMIYLVKMSIRGFAANYAQGEYQVLMPEVTFCVPLPNSEHHCWFAHRLLHPEQPFELCTFSACRIPHYFKGRTDAVIQWNRLIWLLEHKTAASNTQTWWDQWLLDMQGTGYIYGIARSTGTRPHGFLLNKVNKPRKNAADPTSITFEREPYLRTNEDLNRFEKQITMIAEDYETSFQLKRIYMNTQSCLDYNRRCYYHRLCMKHGAQEEGEFIHREPDYVELEYYKILGLPEPNRKEENERPEDSNPA